MEGHGSPEGVVSATAGVTYRNLDGGAGQTFWTKSYGPGTTGWAAMNDPMIPSAIPSGAQLPSLAGLISGNPYVVTADHHLYIVQGLANAAATDTFDRYPTNTALVGTTTLTGGLVYSGTAHANNDRLVSGVALLNLGVTTPHEVSYILDNTVTVGADIVTVYLGSNGTVGSASGFAVAINRSGAFTISNNGSVVNSGNTGQSMIGVEVAVLMNATTGKITIFRAGLAVGSYTPTSAPAMGNYVGISPSLVYSPGVISWVAAALGSLTWLRLEAVPAGGTNTQALRKVSGSDWDYAWTDDPPAVIPGFNTVRSGSGAPDNAVGQNGDWYIRTSTPPVVYGPKASGAWPGSGTSMQGPQGIPGIQGLTGDPGNQLRYGAGAPSSGNGFDGEYYIDQTNSRLYGPKASGAWPGTYVSLTGPQGIPGIQGTRATVSVGTVTTLASGSTATVTDSGTTNDGVLNFGIPRGAVGPTGPATSWSRTLLMIGG